MCKKQKYRAAVFSILTAFFLLSVSGSAIGQEPAGPSRAEKKALRSEIAKLRAALEGLEARLDATEAAGDTLRPTSPDSAELSLEEELARELGGTETSTAAESATFSGSAPPATQQGSVLRGSVARGGSTLNPRLSVIGTFLGTGTSDRAVEKPADLGLEEAEFSFQSYVDPYAKADFFFSYGHEIEDPFAGPDAAAAFSGEFVAELEEGFLTTLSLPFSLQLKAGKFRAAFGKINQSHPHALNFLDLPRMYVNYLGGDGLIDRGAELNWFVPNPFGIYQELTVGVTSGAVEAPSFAGNKDLLYLAHLKSFFDLNENTTLELGLTGLRGSHDVDRNKTNIGAVDLTLRWKPLRLNRYKSFEWMTEALVSQRKTPAGDINSKALYSFLRLQVAKRFFLSGRFDYSEFPENGDAHETAYSGILSFFATEFQKVELEYQHGVPASGPSFERALLRAVFVIGAHGAHKY